MTDLKLTPSGWEQWSNCPGSVRLTAQLREQGLITWNPPDAHRAEGLMMHVLVEKALTVFLESKKETYADRFLDENISIRDYPKLVKVAGTHVEAVNHTLGYVYGRIREFELFDTAYTLLVEARVSATPRLPLGAASNGLADVVLITNRSIEVIDAKFGVGTYVDHVGNHQTRIYALGAMEDHPVDGGYHNVRCTISQPRYRDPSVEKTRSEDIPLHEFETWVKTLQEKAKAVLAPDAALVPSKNACRWCPAKKRCRHHMDVGLEALGVDPKAPSTELFAQVTDAIQAPADSLTDEELAARLKLADLVIGAYEELKPEATKRALAGTKIEGFKLVAGPGRRTFALPEEEVAKKLQSTFKLKKAQYYVTKFASVAQIEKILKASGDLTPRRVKAFDLLVEKTRGKLALVPDSDTRNEVEVNRADVGPHEVRLFANAKPSAVGASIIDSLKTPAPVKTDFSIFD